MHELFVPWRRAALAGLALIGAMCFTGCEYSPSDKDIVVMSFSRVQELQTKSQTTSPKAALLVDPRASEDFVTGHIPGARNLLLSQVNPKRDRDPELEKYDVLIVYGDNPGSAPARAMVKRLLALGYDDVKWFPGGFEEWRDARLPTDPPTPPPAPPAPPSAPAPAAAPK